MFCSSSANCLLNDSYNLTLCLFHPGKRSQASLTERLKKVEDECKLKEDERVSLELELTEVKESLKKALNGGVTLGLTIEPKMGSSSPQVWKNSNNFSNIDMM